MQRELEKAKKNMLNILNKEFSCGSYALQNRLDLDDAMFENVKDSLLKENKIFIGPGYGGSIRLSDDNRVEANAKRVLGYLEKNPGFSTNKAVMDALNMESDDFWRAAYNLRSQGQVMPGVGHGGRIKLAKSYPPVAKFEKALAEDKLMKPLLLGIGSLYELDGRFVCDDFFVENCSQLGRKKTGGTWSRPDIVALIHKQYKYSRSAFEIHSYEVKCSSAIDIRGVYEALAHKKWVHRANLIIHIPNDMLEYDHTEEGIVQIAREASLRGIGFITFQNPYNSSTWNIHCEAEYVPPAPELLEEFMENRCLTKETLKSVSKWLAPA